MAKAKGEEKLMVSGEITFEARAIRCEIPATSDGYAHVADLLEKLMKIKQEIKRDNEQAEGFVSAYA